MDKIIGLLALVFVIFLFLAWLFMLLWNYAVPAVFGLPELSYTQAVALYVLANLVKPTTSSSNKG